MTGALSADLVALEGWLQRNAPVSYRTLRPGLEAQELRALEARYGFPLHPELRILLSWHDGCLHSSLALQIWIDFIFGESEFMFEQVHELPDDYWDPQWVPFATDLGLKTLIVDHGVAPGRVTVFDGVDGLHQESSWSSLGFMIAQVREALTESRALNGRRPGVEDGALCWLEAT
jgi:cell wall assembly regulator SMI1